MALLSIPINGIKVLNSLGLLLPLVPFPKLVLAAAPFEWGGLLTWLFILEGSEARVEGMEERCSLFL